MAEINNDKPVLTDKDLGLDNSDDTTVVKTDIKKETKKQPVTKENSKGVKKADDALKAAIDANNELSANEAEKIYIKEKMNFMLEKCKTDEVVEFRGDKIYAQYFGKVYTFLYNAIPVTVRFDGSEVSESNTPKVQIEDRTGQ